MNDRCPDRRRSGSTSTIQPRFTGATDWFVGLSGFYQFDRRSALFASAQYRVDGTERLRLSLWQRDTPELRLRHKIGARWDAVLEANFRDSRRDEIDAAGTRDGNTGGTIAYLTPRILFDAGHGWVLRASAQLPLSQSGLHGVQHEEPVWNLGVTRLVGQYVLHAHRHVVRPAQHLDRDDALLRQPARYGRHRRAAVRALPEGHGRRPSGPR